MLVETSSRKKVAAKRKVSLSPEPVPVPVSKKSKKVVKKGPKKPLTAYMFYMKEKQPELMKKKNMSMIESTKLLGQMWRDLKNKKKYENMNAVDIKRYQAELDEAQPASTTPKILGKKRAAPSQMSVSPKAVKK
jgi:hypothetical protein